MQKSNIDGIVDLRSLLIRRKQTLAGLVERHELRSITALREWCAENGIDDPDDGWVRSELGDAFVLGPLSKKAKEARKPRPPEELVDAFVHTDLGVSRPATSTRQKRKKRENQDDAVEETVHDVVTDSRVI